MPDTPPPAPDKATPDRSADIESTPLKLRNPDLAPGVPPDHRGRIVASPVQAADITNNYASNGHWDRDDLGPVAYVPPVEAQEDDDPLTEASGHVSAQQGGPNTRKDRP